MFLIKKLNVLTQCAVTISLCTLLGFITIFKMPYGGSVTLGCTAPLILFSFKRGCKAGLYAGFIYSIFQIAFSFHVPPAKSFVVFCASIVLDYFLPYTLAGFAGMFRSAFKNLKAEICASVIFFGILRFVCACVSGTLIWNEYAGQLKSVWCYSAIYNFSYIFPETVITLIICLALLNVFENIA